MMEQNSEFQEDLGTGGKFKNWLQDNIRIVVSVLIVIAIAGGIYSYSKRGTTSNNGEEVALEESTGNQGDQQQEEAVTVVGGEEEQQKKGEEAQPQDQPEQKEVAEQQSENKRDVKVNEPTKENATAVSTETEDAFVETAIAGDSVTTLARKALKDYLEKNNDPSLTAEHKIYIEDYLRKKVNRSGRLLVGDSVSFSKVLIKDAVEKAKTLNEAQLNNLKKYSSRVSGL